MPEPHTVTVVGLGPGNPDHLTVEATRLLAATDSIFVRTERHPTVTALRELYPSLEVLSFDDLYQSATEFEEVYSGIVSKLVDSASRRDVVYCVPGSPLMAEATVELLRPLADAARLNFRIVHGLSYVEPVLASVGVFDTSWLVVVDAFELDLLGSENALGEVPGKSGRLPIRSATPTAPLLIAQVHDRRLAASTKLWLGKYWSDEHEVIVVRGAGTEHATVERTPIHRLDRLEFDHLTSVFVPAVDPVEDVRTFSGLQSVTRTLRAPGGCPWDREQTHDSLKPHLLDESYEVIEALDEHDWDKLSEELGDLLFQIMIHSQVASERGEFDVTDVIAGVTEKLIRRHPHVFADVNLPTSAAVLERWETMKQAEKPARPSVLSGIPVSMPALPYSFAVQKRVANQGFDWPDIDAVFDKVEEELRELRQALAGAEPRARVLEELGDLFFVLVTVGRRLKLDPEEALRRANRKFVGRFQHVESRCKAEGKTLRDLSPEELDARWQEAKGGS